MEGVQFLPHFARLPGCDPSPRRIASKKCCATHTESERRATCGFSGGLGGGIWPLPEGQPMVQLFVGVEDVDATLKTIEANGGRIIFPKQMLPDGDEMAVIADPEGITWGIMRAR
jgi:predicted enzyme related to lactoylglutathione lyase